MADVFLLSKAPAAAQALRRALATERASGAGHALHLASSWPDLFDRAARAGAGVAFVDPYHGGAFAAGEVAGLRARFPAVEVVGYADAFGQVATDAFELAVLGARAVVAPGAPGASARVRECLDAYVGATLLDEAIAPVVARVPPAARGWVRAALRSASPPASVAELARAAHCTPRTLHRILTRAGLPAPDELLAWGRVLNAARLLEDPQRGVASVALALGYSSGSALRRTLRRLTGLRPGELAAAGGVRRVAELFMTRCGTGGLDDLPLPPIGP
jgi:AraC-like DNA-binding protein